MYKANLLTNVIKELRTDIMKKYVMTHVTELGFTEYRRAEVYPEHVAINRLEEEYFIGYNTQNILMCADEYIGNSTKDISPLEELVYISYVQKCITTDTIYEYFNSINVSRILEDYVNKATDVNNNYARNLSDSIHDVPPRDVTPEELNCYSTIATFNSPLLLTLTADLLQHAANEYGTLLINRLIDTDNVNTVITRLNKRMIMNGIMPTTVGFSNLIIKTCKYGG